MAVPLGGWRYTARHLPKLVGGNYTNGLSAMAASIVLLQQTRQRRSLGEHAAP